LRRWSAEDLDGRSENVEHQAVGLSVDAIKDGGKFLLEVHVCTPFSMYGSYND